MERRFCSRLRAKPADDTLSSPRKLSAEQIYAQIEEELRHQYSLSYTPDKAESGYHKLHLSTRNGDLTVQTRPGYYAD